MLSLTIRPVSAFCNSKCHYCYLYNIRENKKNDNLMTDEVIEKLISEYQIEEFDKCRYIWHGGEPTLAGIEFYQKVCGLQKKYKKNKQVIKNSIQTNAWLINPDWCKFFFENNFSVGISLDGPQKINDAQRGRNYYSNTMKGVTYLKKYEIPFSCICVVTSKNVLYADIIISFFYELGFKKISFNPIFGDHIDYNVDPMKFATFLCQIFDRWIELDDPEFEIRFLKETVITILGGDTTLCMMMGGCNNHLVIENNGDILPCYSHDKEYFSIGNINSMNFTEASKIINSQSMPVQKFVSDTCSLCEWYKLCGGDCIRFIEKKDKSFVKTPFCEARKLIFVHIEKSLKEKGYLK